MKKLIAFLPSDIVAFKYLYVQLPHSQALKIKFYRLNSDMSLYLWKVISFQHIFGAQFK